MKKTFKLAQLVALSLISIKGSAQWYLTTGAASTSSTTYIQRQGPVGIGFNFLMSQPNSTVPQAHLHVRGNGAYGSVPYNNFPQFMIENSATGQENSLKVFSSNNPASGINLGNGSFVFQSTNTSNSDLLFMPNPTSAGLVIKNDGKVGIGTESPNFKLEVFNNGGGNVFRANSGAGNPLFDIWQAGTWDSKPRTSLLFTNGAFEIFDNTAGSSGSRLWISPVTGNIGLGNTSPNSKLDINNSGGGIAFTSNMGVSNPKFEIFQANAGIGGPRTSLLFSNGAFEVFDQSANSGTGASRLWISSNSPKIGIATQNPEDLLQIRDGIGKFIIGDCYGGSPFWGTTYLGFNISRQGGTWTTSNNTAANGAAAIIADVAGGITIANVVSTGGTNQQLSDAQMGNNRRFIIDPKGSVTINTSAIHTNTPAFTLKNFTSLTDNFLIYKDGTTRIGDLNVPLSPISGISGAMLATKTTTTEGFLTRVAFHAISTGGYVDDVNSTSRVAVFESDNKNRRAISVICTDPSVTSGYSYIERFKVYADGKTRIGQEKADGNHADAMLSVDGKILAKSIYVNTNSAVWADYVFESNYKLTPLDELEAFYKKNKHLPEVPSAKEVNEKGDNLVEMDVILLKKVEELTLYIVNLEKEIQILKNRTK